MVRKALKEQTVTVPQVKEALESIGEERLDQFQRRSLDYATKFSKVEPSNVDILVTKLVEEFELDADGAVQIVNAMPESVQEIRVFLAGGRKIIESSKLEKILDFLNEYRKDE
ncbi:MAG: RNA polymerase Rpb4 [Candidatus Bathyarchaeota archaeon]|nr:RNA polymerase Rpb4 family protein [Candidatus Bathyarchaeum tardum]WGM89650.1 MAG: RNA polymerase Rpb4 family protein [Candidatus Bathyarchaeum tardum]WNZ30248.1 MAG: RNA polymerase Rpb4 [Candidatus Bathyarchaeota archaeon]